MSEPGASERTAVRCPQCGRRFAVAPANLGRRARCPGCRAEFVLSADGEEQPAAAPPAGGLCPVCQAETADGEAPTVCPGCQSRYHVECWEYNGGCGVYGCSEVPPTEKLTDLEMPASWWGNADKPCPQCNMVIKAAAVRCRYCGATFASARPEDLAQFTTRTTRERNLPALRTQSVWLLVGSLIPCLAPIMLVIDLLWYRRHRRSLGELPGLFAALGLIALIVAAVQTAAAVLAALLYAVFGGGA